MTWSEFKTFVESKGVIDEMRVDYIDVLSDLNEVVVSIHANSVIIDQFPV